MTGQKREREAGKRKRERGGEGRKIKSARMFCKGGWGALDYAADKRTSGNTAL